MSKPAIAEVGDNHVLNVNELKKYTERLLKLKKQQDDLRMDVLGVYNAADDVGLDRKALKEVVKVKSKSRSSDHMAAVNEMLEALGDFPIYSDKA